MTLPNGSRLTLRDSIRAVVALAGVIVLVTLAVFGAHLFIQSNPLQRLAKYGFNTAPALNKRDYMAAQTANLEKLMTLMQAAGPVVQDAERVGDWPKVAASIRQMASEIDSVNAAPDAAIERALAIVTVHGMDSAADVLDYATRVDAVSRERLVAYVGVELTRSAQILQVLVSEE